MKFPRIIAASVLAASAIGGLQAQDVSNTGQSVPAAIQTVSTAAKVTNPFVKECAATTKSKFAAYFHRGGGLNCAFAGQIGPSRNLLDFTNPSTGVYCFQPSPGAGVSKNNKLNGIYPRVDIEWGHSSGSMLLAYALEPSATSGFSCPAGYIEVRTYDISGGSAALTGNVAFYLQAN